MRVTSSPGSKAAIPRSESRLSPDPPSHPPPIRVVDQATGRSRVPPGLPPLTPESVADAAAAAGLRFVDSLLASGTIRAAYCSLSRDSARPVRDGQMASTREGDRVLHFGCGEGSAHRSF